MRWRHQIEVKNHALWMHVNEAKVKWNLKACIKCRPVGQAVRKWCAGGIAGYHGYKLQVTAMETVDMKVNVASSRWSLAKHHVRIHVISKSKNSEIL